MKLLETKKFSLISLNRNNPLLLESLTTQVTTSMDLSCSNLYSSYLHLCSILGPKLVFCWYGKFAMGNLSQQLLGNI